MNRKKKYKKLIVDFWFNIKIYEWNWIIFFVVVVWGFVKYSMSSLLVFMYIILGKNFKNSNNENGSVVECYCVFINVYLFLR